jgi:hypothetical protein
MRNYLAYCGAENAGSGTSVLPDPPPSSVFVRRAGHDVRRVT